MQNETSKTQTVGMIGVGEMGGVIGTRLIQAGHQVIGFDTSRENLDRFVSAGGQAADSALVVANAAECVFACLPSPSVSIDVALEISTAGVVKTYIETSTIGLQTIEKIEEILAGTDINLVDAPVSGGISAMLQGKAAMVVSGMPSTIETVEPLLIDITPSITRAGDKTGNAQICKLVNNAISFTAFVVSCEALAVGVQAGVDANILLNFINNGSGRNSATLDKIPRAILPRSFKAGGQLDTVPKDLNLYLGIAENAGMPDMMVAKTESVWQEAIAALGKEVDYSYLATFMEGFVGSEIKG